MTTIGNCLPLALEEFRTELSLNSDEESLNIWPKSDLRSLELHENRCRQERRKHG